MVLNTLVMFFFHYLFFYGQYSEGMALLHLWFHPHFHSDSVSDIHHHITLQYMLKVFSNWNINAVLL